MGQRRRFPVWTCAVGLLLASVDAGVARAAARAAALADSPFGAVIAATETARLEADASQGNRRALVSGGYDTLLLRVPLIRQATVSVSIQTFIWTNDECGRLAFAGSSNLDPRLENLNTEVGLLGKDEAFAAELGAESERDMRPENSWVIARRVLPLRLEAVNKFIDDTLSLGPLDVWPFQNTSSFELKLAAPAVAPTHADFHRHYRDVGPFPGTDGLLSTKEILTRLSKAVRAPLPPIL